MLKFFEAMALEGEAVWWNVAFQFLRLYYFLFSRISRGATRLQEVLADRAAAQLYGKESFEEGLRHVVRRDVEFEYYVGNELEEASQTRRPLGDLYSIQANGNAAAEAEIERRLSRPTTESDTHPGPGDRFRLISRVADPRVPLSDGMVWDLFADREKLTREMSVELARQKGCVSEFASAADMRDTPRFWSA